MEAARVPFLAEQQQAGRKLPAEAVVVAYQVRAGLQA